MAAVFPAQPEPRMMTLRTSYGSNRRKRDVRKKETARCSLFQRAVINDWNGGYQTKLKASQRRPKIDALVSRFMVKQECQGDRGAGMKQGF